jgi:hypothetical protein
MVGSGCREWEVEVEAGRIALYRFDFSQASRGKVKPRDTQ